MTDHHCRYCEQTHDDRYLCDPMKRLIDALYARGAELTIPDVTFPEPIPDHERRLGIDSDAGDALVAQLVAQAGLVDVAGVAKPVLVLTGLDSRQRPLPRWYVPGDPEDLDNLVGLVKRMVGLAIRTARQTNRRPA